MFFRIKMFFSHSTQNRSGRTRKKTFPFRKNNFRSEMDHFGPFWSILGSFWVNFGQKCFFRFKMFFSNQNVFFAFNSKSARPDSQKNNSVQKKQFPFRNGPFRAILVHFGLILGQFGSKMFFRFKMFFLQKVYSPFSSARPDSQKTF